MTKDNFTSCTKIPAKVKEDLQKLFSDRVTCINSINNAADGDNESEDEVEISMASNVKGRKSGGKKGRLICFVEIQVLQYKR